MGRIISVIGTVALAFGAVSASASPTARMHANAGGGAASVSGLAAAPASLRAALSAALGARAPRFALHGDGSDLRASGGTLSARFGSRGPVVSAGGARLGLVFVGIGHGTRLAPPGTPVRTVAGNEVFYWRGAVTEWYRNGPLGLEQGFTLRARPAGAAGWLTVATGVSGALRPSERGDQIVFSGASGGAPLLRYGGLSALDARGRPLPTRLALRGHTLLLRVDDRRARYPLTLDPLLQQGAKLSASDETAEGTFGFSVALSADGTTALVGGPDDNAGGGPSCCTGAAWVFTRSGSGWTQQGPKLAATDESGEAFFGSSVALSADGNTALIGGYGDDKLGAAWVFTRSGSNWTQQGAKLTGAGASANAAFGFSVALSGDGNTALVGGDNDANGLGAAWVFTRSGTSWAQQGATLSASDESGAGAFGTSTALSADGNTALVGGDNDANGLGAAWVFTRSGTSWTQQGAKLTPAESGLGEIGQSVALSGDGSTALLSGLSFSVQGPFGTPQILGSAWVFTRSGSSWAAGAQLTPSDQTGPESEGFFHSVALSADGTTALIGLGGDKTSSGQPDGAAWTFARTGSSWAQQGTKLNGSDQTASAAFGGSVALSASGQSALIGGPGDSGGSGAAWVFSATDTTAPTTTITLTPSAPNGSNGWYRSPVAVAVSATDNPGGSGVAQTRCALDPGGVPANFAALPAAPCAVSGVASDGTHTLYAASEDGANNVESPLVTSSFKLDQTPPRVSYSGDAGSYALLDTVTISCSAADALSGLASSSCANLSAPAWTFGPGTHTLSATATDNAGNSASGSTSFTVNVNPGGLCALTGAFVRGSARYEALRAAQKAALAAAVRAGCLLLTAIGPNRDPARAHAFLVAYARSVEALVPPGWLTREQANALREFARAL